MLDGAERVLKLVKGLLLYRPESTQTIARTLEQHAQRSPGRVFLYFGERSYTYAQANARINRHAHAYRALGIAAGDVVALFMENRPEFLWHLLALHKLGAIGSLINTNLQADALVHAIRICEPKRILIGSEVWPSIASVLIDLGPDVHASLDVDVDSDRPAGTQTFDSSHASIWEARLAGASEDNPSVSPAPTLHDQAAFIYTSGTTGLPKAAIVRHERFFRAGAVWSGLAFRFRTGDVLYNCLPLYHANAVILATSSVITAGVSMVLARKFSRSRFWADIRRYNATQFIYIGELCRYLMNSPPSAEDLNHRIRAISGNGLRPDIWKQFQKRFGISHIAEFYAATEGNAITVNALGLTGSVGPRLRGMRLVRWDEEADDFVRDPNGRLQRAKLGQPGLLLGKIRARAQFDGYKDRQASEQKIVRDAFSAGDAWFNTGDLLRLDMRGHLYFVDRLGDTFRWKGENVATSEVQEHLGKLESIAEVNVYGVAVPGTEGKAGMAAVVLRDGAELDLGALRAHVTSGLPAYARPVFVRVLRELQKTSTFKLKKVDLQRDGFDPGAGPVYFLEPKSAAYVELTPETYASIQSGALRL
jgi:acyl-CoA synthetase (AMP-forming)/AMP-acid ligase II